MKTKGVSDGATNNHLKQECNKNKNKTKNRTNARVENKRQRNMHWIRLYLGFRVGRRVLRTVYVGNCNESMGDDDHDDDVFVLCWIVLCSVRSLKGAESNSIDLNRHDWSHNEQGVMIACVT